MSTVERDDEREHRIEREIIVDAYTAEEQVMGWYYYLENHLKFPFKADWNGEEVEAVEMSSEDDCLEDMFVEVRYREGEDEDVFSVPLIDINPIKVDEKTTEAIADWNYWVGRGYEFLEANH